MATMRHVVRTALVVALLAGATAVTPATAQDTRGAEAYARIDAAIRARSLGLTEERFSGSDLSLEPMRAPTGAGVSRWPKEPDGSSGFYLSTVGCRNDWMSRSQRPARSRDGRRSEAAPSRPVPAKR
jgi:hypothetical protein